MWGLGSTSPCKYILAFLPRNILSSSRKLCKQDSGWSMEEHWCNIGVAGSCMIHQYAHRLSNQPKGTSQLQGTMRWDGSVGRPTEDEQLVEYIIYWPWRIIQLHVIRIMCQGGADLDWGPLFSTPQFCNFPQQVAIASSFHCEQTQTELGNIETSKRNISSRITTTLKICPTNFNIVSFTWKLQPGLMNI